MHLLGRGRRSAGAAVAAVVLVAGLGDLFGERVSGAPPGPSDCERPAGSAREGVREKALTRVVLRAATSSVSACADSVLVLATLPCVTTQCVYTLPENPNLGARSSLTAALVLSVAIQNHHAKAPSL